MSPTRILATVAVAVAAVACMTPPPPPDGVAYEILCPVTGTVSFTNDWHAPRSGGTLHEGNDIMAPRGTPSVAVVDGEIRWAVGTKSGYAIWLIGEDDNEYFYAHYDAWAHTGAAVGKHRDVVAGEVIGYVGDTGNATGTPHVHFEIHPDGDSPVNPYPSLYAACTNRTAP
jgi:murein DD-endopeptidase MepM/ murein hydrolase activator NlpD